MSARPQRRILFLDRDGTLIVEPPDQQIDSIDKFRLVDGVIPALLRLRDAGFEFVMVTNQDGLGTPGFPREAFEPPQRLLLGILETQGIRFSAIHVDPHFEHEGAPTRKPGIGMLLDYLRGGQLDFDASAVIGDRDTDLELARNLGVRGFKLGDGAWTWPELAHALASAPRQASVERTTKETRVRASVDLDREAPAEVATGIGFFDHMLEQLGRHGGFALTLTCAGDTHIDEHHTVEDSALTLGEALRKALGDKRGIARYGFVLPMDETRAEALIDLSGRAHFVFGGDFRRERVGELPTELVPHFFRSLADALGANLHLRVDGDNAHHMVEACFKAFARALRQAIRREGTELPSTKGVL
ncbi:MAG TPA: bifunctional histidinol-phosphatase/imidazoleglycerol-phosphate dehydratase HisB [Xanthomonadales bacterium]|nr:bifunctional histidinol-phosphatase/imidazoleglycerol-phosphate dehydratase HisB [Xanthomonadales bacterium]